jgi:protein-S-isoprenylcysteine O-methyltransferase Ste14
MSDSVEEREQQSAADRHADDRTARNPMRWLLRVPVPWVFVLGYVVGAILESWVRLGPGLAVPRAASQTAGIVLFAAGLVIAGWGLTIFHRVGTTTVPGQSSHRLVTWGPYRFTRNPMYVGLTLAYLGEAALMRQLWPVPLLLLVLAHVQWTVIPLEESRLREAFGADYTAYCARVRRWL